MADLSTCAPFTAASIAHAHEKIKAYINGTDLVTSEPLDRLASSLHPRSIFNKSTTKTRSAQEPSPPTTGLDLLPLPKFNLFFKCENLQRTGAFKARGAFHAVIRLVDDMGMDQVRLRGVITASSGNHAQGLALAAATFGIPAVIVMPKTSTKSKVMGVAEILGVEELDQHGGKGAKREIIFCGSPNEQKRSVVDEATRKTHCVFVPPYAHPDVILGQGTCAKELEEQFWELRPDCRETGLDAVLAPIGGGGLLGGIATWFSDKPRTKVFGAEPLFQGADDARRGVREGSRVEHVSSSTIADGLRTPVGELNWGIVSDKTKVEDIFAVGEEEIKMTMKLLYEELGMLIEPSGCVPLAVVLFDAEFREMVAKRQADDGAEAWNVAIVLSGGNTTIDMMRDLTGKL